MIESPEANVQLTFEQLQQIDTAQKRLTNIQNEVNAAAKILSETRNDTDRITREKEYQQGLLDTVNTELSAKQKEKTQLDEAILQAKAVLHETEQVTSIAKSTHEAKAMELKEREDKLTEREISHARQLGIFSDHVNQLNKEKQEIADKKAKLQSIIEIL